VPDTRSGPGRMLIAVYAIFALSATARSTYQITTGFGDAPVAYLLSALAAVTYIVATVGLARGYRRLATVACVLELVGVLTVGVVSLLEPRTFPDATVWSAFGKGYGFVPAVLPVLGLLWLRHTARTAARSRT
jgi:hypothetical protein